MKHFSFGSLLLFSRAASSSESERNKSLSEFGVFPFRSLFGEDDLVWKLT